MDKLEKASLLLDDVEDVVDEDEDDVVDDVVGLCIYNEDKSVVFKSLLLSIMDLILVLRLNIFKIVEKFFLDAV